MKIRTLQILVMTTTLGAFAGCGHMQSARDRMTRKHCFPYVLPEATPTETGCYTEPAFFGYHQTCWNRWPEGWVGCPVEVIEESSVEQIPTEALVPMPEIDDTPPMPPKVDESTPGAAPGEVDESAPGTAPVEVDPSPAVIPDPAGDSTGTDPDDSTTRRPTRSQRTLRKSAAAAKVRPVAQDDEFIGRTSRILEQRRLNQPPSAFQPVSSKRPLMAPVGEIESTTSEILQSRRESRSRYTAATAGPDVPETATSERANLFGPPPAARSPGDTEAKALGQYVRFHSRWSPTHQTGAVQALQARMAERAGLSPAPIQATEVNRFNPNGK